VTRRLRPHSTREALDTTKRDVAGRVVAHRAALSGLGDQLLDKLNERSGAPLVSSLGLVGGARGVRWDKGVD
jgi:hypothetical protein